MPQATAKDLVLNKPLPWPLYDARGQLLLREGFVLTMADYVDRILARGAYIKDVDYLVSANDTAQASRTIAAAQRHTAPAPLKAPVMRAGAGLGEARAAPGKLGPVSMPAETGTAPVFQRVEGFILALRKIHRMARDPDYLKVVLPAVMELADDVIAAFKSDMEALVAGAILSRQPRDYRQNQQLIGAIAALAILQQIPHTPEFQRDVVCACLTRDFGLLGLDAEMGVAGPLPPAATNSIRAHVKGSIQALQAAGVTSPVWLRAVLEHHERLDGSGYPRQLAGDALAPESRIIGIADSYAALIVPGGRGGQQPSGNVLRDLFLAKEQYDANLVGALYKTLTMHPPGSLVRLANGEIAVVKTRLVGDTGHVLSIYSQEGMPRSVISPRDTADAAYKITGAVLHEAYRAVDVLTRKIWAKGSVV